MPNEGLFYEHIYVPCLSCLYSDTETARLFLKEVEMLGFKFGKSFRTSAPWCAPSSINNFSEAFRSRRTSTLQETTQFTKSKWLPNRLPNHGMQSSRNPRQKQPSCLGIA